MPVRYIPHPIRADAFDLIGARAYAGNYQNLRLRPIVVVVTSQHTSGGVGSQARAIAYIDPPPGPAANAVGYSGWLNAPGAGRILQGIVSFHVPPGYVYRVLSIVAGGGGNALNEWWEWWL